MVRGAPFLSSLLPNWVFCCFTNTTDTAIAHRLASTRSKMQTCSHHPSSENTSVDPYCSPEKVQTPKQDSAAPDKLDATCHHSQWQRKEQQLPPVQGLPRAVHHVRPSDVSTHLLIPNSNRVHGYQYYSHSADKRIRSQKVHVTCPAVTWQSSSNVLEVKLHAACT